MITLPQIWRNVLIFLGLKNQEPPAGMVGAIDFATEYSDKTGVNLVYVGANNVANLVTTDATIEVEPLTEQTNARVEFLGDAASRLWSEKKKIVSRAAGVGMACAFPYVSNSRKIMYNLVTQDRISVFATDGERPTDLAVLADTSLVGTIRYAKYRRYTLTGGNHVFSEFYGDMTSGAIIGVEPPAGTSWEKIEPITIGNVDRLLFGAFRCPIDPRYEDNFYGVPLTDGCKDIIKSIQEQFAEIDKEFKLKRAFIGASELLFKKDASGRTHLPDSQLYRLMDATEGKNGGAFFEVFSPDIRYESYRARLIDTLKMLETQIGLSQGVYTQPDNIGQYSNQSNIKRSVLNTYSFVTDFRDNVRAGMGDYLYACDVLAEAYGLTPFGARQQYSFNISWSNAMIEDTQMEFQQQLELSAAGALSKAELRQWVRGGTLEDAEKAVEEIGATVMPPPQDMAFA